MAVGKSAVGKWAVGKAPVAAGGASPQTISVLHSSETDAGQGITVSTTFLAAIGAANEAESAQSITPVTAGATGILPATESDSAQAIAPVLGAVTIAVGAATESDVAQPISYSAGATVVSIGTAAETATVQAITPVPGGVIVTVGVATEVEGAQAITYYVPGVMTLTPVDLTAIDALILARLSDIAAAVGARIVEGALTQDMITRILLAGVAGKRQGLGTATEEYLAQDGVTPRITFAPTDAAGNGTPVVDGS